MEPNSSNFPLIEETNPMLRLASRDWDFSNPFMPSSEFEQFLIKRQVELGGIGLSAVQIGIPYRCFSMGSDKIGYRAYFNPSIVWKSEIVLKESEGCLSFPNLVLDIERALAILVRYSNSVGETIEEELNGLWARCFQHELDHLNGICFDTRVSKLSLGIAQRKRAKAAKRMQNGR